MAQQAPSRSKIPQPARGRASSHAKSGRTAPGRMLASGAGRAATRGAGPVIELDCGIPVYPAREEQGRWRAVWHENVAAPSLEGSWHTLVGYWPG
jgi:hypothetical protein